MWIHILFTHYQLTGHLGWFYFLTSMNNVALNINVQIFVWIYLCNSLESISRNVIDGSYGNSNILRHFQAVSKAAELFHIPTGNT